MRRVTLYIIVAIVIVALAGAGIYFFVQQSSEPTPAFTSATTSTSTSVAASISSAAISSTTPAAPGMKRYFDQEHHFTLEYPQNLQVSEFPGDGSSIVVAFKDPSTGEGFQVFAVPYDEPKITQARFEEDEPSGVMQNPQNITVDGAPATEFYSQSQAMGDTFEVWFINKGILYEVTTFKSLDSSLLQILDSWKFVR